MPTRLYRAWRLYSGLNYSWHLAWHKAAYAYGNSYNGLHDPCTAGRRDARAFLLFHSARPSWQDNPNRKMPQITVGRFATFKSAVRLRRR